MTITSFLRSAVTFQVRKRIEALLPNHLPDYFILLSPHALMAAGDSRSSC